MNTDTQKPSEHAKFAGQAWLSPDNYPWSDLKKLIWHIDQHAISPAVAELQAQLQHKARELASATGYLAEAQAEIARLKANIGCAREQGSTQYCAEVLGRDKRIAELEEECRSINHWIETELDIVSPELYRIHSRLTELLAKKGQP